uniref:Secreted protein n=1 Tax=Romanomermis culicivorax TaxID=13658 RepID=A0A915K6E8_ROMCU
MLWITIWAGRIALSTSAVGMTNVGCKAEELVVAGTVALVADVNVTTVEGNSAEAIVGNNIVVLLAIWDLVVVGSLSTGGARGNRALNSNCSS